MSIHKNNVQEIFCDESGFTGPNLLDSTAPFFTYSAVAVSNEEAKEFVEKLIKDYKIQSGELKANKMRKSSPGRKAITHILEKFSTRAKVVVHDKKYSLACKFYEYIFEPALASKNSIFYDIEFHNFVSNLLYIHFKEGGNYAECIFNDFYQFMKMDYNNFFDSLSSPKIPLGLNEIKEFCIHQREIINLELDSIKGTNVGKWVLDLSSSSLFSLLGEWGQESYQLKVFCDSSKPLKEQLELFEEMVNKEDKEFIEVAGKQHPISFNLIEIPKLADSKKFPGIQIADVFAGTAAFVFGEISKDKHKSYPTEWKQYLAPCISSYSVTPCYKHLDFNTVKVKLNSLILQELARRSIEKQPLLEGIETLIERDQESIYVSIQV
ncbi:DUF3800 domain-containing protein [Geitlerinema sp. P-1104]|uniref:DUF3800 domain-containing protein n=1 Tax=Geitlerinema sp. P-1104 TaxID=2546230 RepID=UPI0014775868|nr:DUF3800 domain-containing protein [Geitlerinema sp. P-1104]NMG58369.1 DUF3800 domain-containing protein [Geitlerinema sp. P-1104]